MKSKRMIIWRSALLAGALALGTLFGVTPASASVPLAGVGDCNVWGDLWIRPALHNMEADGHATCASNHNQLTLTVRLQVWGGTAGWVTRASDFKSQLNARDIHLLGVQSGCHVGSPWRAHVTLRLGNGNEGHWVSDVKYCQ